MISSIRSPFRRINECVEVINQIDDAILSRLESNIVPFFIRMLEHRYGARVYYPPAEIEGDYIILADTRLPLARICGADYELERTYRLEILNHSRPVHPSVSFVSWMPEHCGVHCHYDVDQHKLTLMPMTAAVLRFPEAAHIRVDLD
jgi:hypothetical protein